jgi:C4-dicarboxylate transporter DctM subunit
MSPDVIGVIGVAALLLLIFSEMPIGFALALVGYLGFTCVAGFEPGFSILRTIPYSTTFSYSLSVLPLFILMGQFAFKAGLSRDLYTTAYKWLGALPGGLAIATIGGCAGFAAVSGSSVATAATMGTVALPEMRRYNYDPALAAGCCAAGGTLGILIPPSLGFILYGIVTEESISKLFISGILPGLLLSTLFMAVVYVRAKANPRLAPPGAKTGLREKVVSLKDPWPILVLFVLVMGGIYSGIFTATEAGGIGAFATLSISLVMRRLSWQSFIHAILDAGQVTAFILFILVGATIFNAFLAASTLPTQLANFARGLHVSPYVILLIIIIIYLILGCIMDIAAALLLTLPIFYPVVIGIGFDSIWFGVICVFMWEMGAVSPPVGMNVFVIGSLAKDVPLSTVFRGIFPFLMAMLVCLFILILFPWIATFLPSLM